MGESTCVCKIDHAHKVLNNTPDHSWTCLVSETVSIILWIFVIRYTEILPCLEGALALILDPPLYVLHTWAVKRVGGGGVPPCQHQTLVDCRTGSNFFQPSFRDLSHSSHKWILHPLLIKALPYQMLVTQAIEYVKKISWCNDEVIQCLFL